MVNLQLDRLFVVFGIFSVVVETSSDLRSDFVCSLLMFVSFAWVRVTIFLIVSVGVFDGAFGWSLPPTRFLSSSGALLRTVMARVPLKISSSRLEIPRRGDEREA